MALKRLAILMGLATATLMGYAQRYSRQDYIDKYSQWAVNEMRRVGIPASITLAQGILESDCGNSDLAVVANNHFGIKCHSDWTGGKFFKDDDAAQECFRTYDDAYKSFVDHSNFLFSGSRYSKLFKLKRTDYSGWAHGLKSCGYATAADYATRLIKIIEEEGLSKYDQEDGQVKTEVLTADELQKETDVIQKKNNERRTRKPTIKTNFTIDAFEVHEVMYNNGVRYVEVGDNDTFASIAKEFNMMEWEILKYNDLDQSARIGDMRYIYIRPKKSRSHPDCKTHTVEAGETAWSIAHKYGIKLRKLESRNNLQHGQKLKAGTELTLR